MVDILVEDSAHRMVVQVRLYGGVRYIDRPAPENVRRLDMGALPMIHAMHKNGIRLDVPYLRALDEEIVCGIRDIDEKIRGELGNAYRDFDGKKHQEFNPGSPDQVARLLFHHLQLNQGLAVEMTKGGKRETVDADTLAMYRKAHPVVPLLEDRGELSKLHGTYTGALPLLVDSDGYLHTKFSATTAATGRLSSSNPNLQNIPVRTELGRRIRRAFIASPGCVLVSADLSQIEMRWAAHRSQDPTMMEVFRREEDVHTRTTCNVFGLDYEWITALTRKVDTKLASAEEAATYKHFKQFQRLPCKTVGFGVLYGQTALGLMDGLAKEGVMWGLEECEALIDRDFFGVYPGLRDMLERDHWRARRYGMVWDNFGRTRLVPEAKSSHKRIANEGVRKAGNHPEQSGAQGGLKLGMAEANPVCEEFDRDCRCRPVLQVHDQLIVDVDRRIAAEFSMILTQILEGAAPLTIPVRSSADVGETWFDL